MRKTSKNDKLKSSRQHCQESKLPQSSGLKKKKKKKVCNKITQRNLMEDLNSGKSSQIKCL